MSTPLRRRFGQHFLRDPAILKRIAESTLGVPGDPVLEIGPGQGTLTRALVQSGFQVTAIEKDRDLLPALRKQFDSVRIAEGDALELVWEELAGVRKEDLIIVGNIPYNITTPLLERALEPPRPKRIVFLMQKEVGDRLAATPGTKAYGALTVGVQAAAKVERLFGVRAGAFDPPPQVDSAVVRLTPLTPALVDEALSGRFRRLVRALFSARRKQLQRALRQITGWAPDQVERVIGAAGLEPAVRPDAVPVAGFVRLLGAIVDEAGREG